MNYLNWDMQVMLGLGAAARLVTIDQKQCVPLRQFSLILKVGPVIAVCELAMN
jgi:hypothetical protein